MRLMALLLLVVASYGVCAQCSSPTGLSTSNVTATSGLASWAPVSGATSYNVEYKPASSSSWTAFGFGTTGLLWTISGLEATTSYDWRVKANCTTGSSSYTQAQFTTQATGSCTAPGGLFTSNVTSSMATMNWSPVSGAFYSVYYKPASSGIWLTAASATYSTSYNLYGLSAATSYNWRVYANCSLTEISNSSTTEQFTTSGSTPAPASPCPGPYDISTNGTFSGAAAIGVNTDVKGTIAPKYDNDYYQFTISTGGSFTVWLTALPANYDLAVYNSSQTLMGISQNSGSKSEYVSLYVLNGGTYYAKVFPRGNANNARSCYTLKVKTATATQAAPAVNDVIATVTNVTAPTTQENGNPKFAINLFPNPAGDQLNVWVEGVDKKTQIKVYDLMGKLVMQQGSGNTLTQLNISKLPAGIYMLNVNNGGETKAAKFVKQ